MSYTMDSLQPGVTYQPYKTVKASGYTDVKPNLRGSVVGGKRRITYRSRRENLRKVAKDCMLKLAERKHSSTSFSITGIPAVGTVSSLSILTQGTGALNRIGNQIHCTELEWFVQPSLPAAAGSDTVRFIIGLDHQPDGGLPSVGDVLEGANFIQPYNKDKVGSRFRILCDKMVPLENYAATVSGRYVILHGKIKLDFVTYYQSNGGTISDLLKNNLFVIVISQNATANFGGWVQLCYKDL